MQAQRKPWIGSERLYFCPQSAQIVGQAGQTGYVSADFGSHGGEYCSLKESLLCRKCAELLENPTGFMYN